MESPTSQAPTPEQQHSPSSSQDANKNKSKKVSLTEYLQRKKNERKAEPLSRQITREDSVDSIASSEMTTMTGVATALVENSSVAQSTTEEDNKLLVVTSEVKKDTKAEGLSPANFLDKESTVEVVESGKSKVNKLLTSLMAKNKQSQQQLQQQKSKVFDFDSLVNTGIDLFAKRSLFNNTTSIKTPITTSNDTTPVAVNVATGPSNELTQSIAEAGEIEDEPALPLVKDEALTDTKSRSSSANSCHRSRKSSLSEPNSRSSSSNSSAGSSVSNSLTGASSSVESRSSRNSSSAKKAKTTPEASTVSSSSERQKQRHHNERSIVRDRESKQREKRRAKSSSGTSRHRKHQRRSHESKCRSQVSVHQEPARTKSSSRRADSELVVRGSNQNMSSSSQSSLGSSSSGHEYAKYSSKTHSRKFNDYTVRLRSCSSNSVIIYRP